MTILTVLVAVVFLGAGTAKLAGARPSLEMRDHLRLSVSTWRLIGGLEVAGAIGALAGLLWDPIGVASLAGLAALMLGAIITRMRAHDGLAWLGVDAVALGLVAVTLLSVE